MELSLATNALDTPTSGVLQQREVKGWQPLGFFSKKLLTIELKFSAFDWELLWTDHKLLLAALHRVSEPWTPRQQRQLSFIAECTGGMLHVSVLRLLYLSWTTTS